MLVNPANPMTSPRLEVIRDVGHALKVEIRVVTATGARELDETLRGLQRSRPAGLIVFEDPVFSLSGQRTRIIDFAARQRVPVLYTQSGWAELGGLVEYAPNQIEMFRQAAAYVDRVLRGTKPADLPVEQPTRFDLVINLGTARALGLAVPRRCSCGQIRFSSDETRCRTRARLGPAGVDLARRCVFSGRNAWPSGGHFMPVTVRIPTPLRSVTKGNADVQAKGDTVDELIGDLERQFPGLRERLVDESGELRRFVNIYVNQEDIRFMDNRATTLKDGDEVAIVPAIAGGR